MVVNQVRYLLIWTDQDFLAPKVARSCSGTDPLNEHSLELVHQEAETGPHEPSHHLFVRRQSCPIRQGTGNNLVIHADRPMTVPGRRAVRH